MNKEQILSQFTVRGTLISCELFGEGHINTTELLQVQEEEGVAYYILQKMHPTAFPDIPRLMDNIERVTRFLSKKLRKRGRDPMRYTLNMIPTTSGHTYYFDGESYYRLCYYIDNSTVFQKVEEDWQFTECGYAFGRFARLLEEFDASSLFETIPQFHNTENRYRNLLKAIENNKSQRAHLVEKEIQWAKDHAYLASYLTSKLASGELPIKVTHNDTKLNNVLFDKDTGENLAVIDLDTVMAGTICFDFGDAIRFGCNTASEDEVDLSKVDFSLPLFRAFADGYLRGIGTHVEKSEIDALAMSALVMTYECGIRFLTDYLDGDVYFKTAHKNHNLDRCRTQFLLVDKMTQLLPQMEKIVQECEERIMAEKALEDKQNEQK